MIWSLAFTSTWRSVYAKGSAAPNGAGAAGEHTVV